MAKKTKKQKHTQKRKEIRRRQKARQQSLPKILRQDPLLLEALNFHHPLKECLLNKNWKAERIATVFFIREGPTGFVFTCFLVDLAGFGLKDAWGDYGLTQNDIEELKSKAAEEEHPLISCDPTLAETIVYTGIEWARKWQFKLPREYRVYPTVDMDGFRVKAGDFFAARIVPARGFHTFSGAASLIESDGSDEHRAEVYKTAAEVQMKYPERAFQDNQEKLQKSLQAAREQYEDFVQYFGSDEVVGTGKKIMQNYQDFFDYRIYEKKNPNTGLTPAQSYADDTGKVYQPPQVQLPRNVIRSPDVGMLCDPVEGPSFLIDYRQFIDVFEYPEQQLGRRGAEDLVLGYLESDTISDVPFRRVAQKFPDNFKQVISYYGNQEGFFSSRIDDLMLEFKPDTFDKLPGIVVILDNEAANLSKKPNGS